MTKLLTSHNMTTKLVRRNMTIQYAYGSQYDKTVNCHNIAKYSVIF